MYLDVKYDKKGEGENERKRELNVKIWWETKAHSFLIKPRPGVSFKANCYQQSESL